MPSPSVAAFFSSTAFSVPVMSRFVPLKDSVPFTPIFAPRIMQEELLPTSKSPSMAASASVGAVMVNVLPFTSTLPTTSQEQNARNAAISMVPGHG